MRRRERVRSHRREAGDAAEVLGGDSVVSVEEVELVRLNATA
jgi:hypothetical protein